MSSFASSIFHSIFSKNENNDNDCYNYCNGMQQTEQGEQQIFLYTGSVFLMGLFVGVLLSELMKKIRRVEATNTGITSFCATRSHNGTTNLKSLKEDDSSINTGSNSTEIETETASESSETETETETGTDRVITTPQAHALNNNEGGVEVLNESLSLFQEQMSKTRNNSKVVEYLSPEDMLKDLFAEGTFGSLSLKPTKSESPYKSKSKSNLLEQKDNNQTRNQNEIIQCFRQIQKYSVNANHPFFFNQLFGALDPIALAAEIIGLSAHSSAYTWETAPVFTMIEREVFKHLGKLVFENICPEDDAGGGVGDGDGSDDYDGLMLPGGALSNLTALHIARHFTNERLRESSKIHRADISSIPSESHEEKKQDEFEFKDHEVAPTPEPSPNPGLVAFVSAEAHYSFSKSVSVTGIGVKNLIVVPTHLNGQMDVDQLDILMTNLMEENDAFSESMPRIPFFVAATAGSTVRGSFDDIDAIIQVCKKHEARFARCYPEQQHYHHQRQRQRSQHKIWIHVDGAWGGSAIFSKRNDLQSRLKGLNQVDSFTFNPHKLIGAPQQTTAFVTRHKGILGGANSTEAKYLFDPRKNGAKYDLGDMSYTCGRRTDAIKLWAQWKYYGTEGLGRMVDSKVVALEGMVEKIRASDRFMLACEPCPFNVNFFYLPARLRKKVVESASASDIDFRENNPIIPTDISQELAVVSVALKLRLHQSGEVLIPFQPISNQEADCFRIVLAGNKPFDSRDTDILFGLMDKYGHDL